MNTSWYYKGKEKKKKGKNEDKKANEECKLLWWWCALSKKEKDRGCKGENEQPHYLRWMMKCSTRNFAPLPSVHWTGGGMRCKGDQRKGQVQTQKHLLNIYLSHFYQLEFKANTSHHFQPLCF